MFIKNKNSSESFIHVCNGLTEKQMRNKAIEIRLHDITIFSFIYDDTNNFKIEHISFCPYCGIDLHAHAFPPIDEKTTEGDKAE